MQMPILKGHPLISHYHSKNHSKTQLVSPLNYLRAKIDELNYNACYYILEKTC